MVQCFWGQWVPTHQKQHRSEWLPLYINWPHSHPTQPRKKGWFFLFKMSVPTDTVVNFVQQCSTFFMLCRCPWASCGHAGQWRSTRCACVTCNDASWPWDQPSSTTSSSCTAASASAWDASNTSGRVSYNVRVRKRKCFQYCCVDVKWRMQLHE